MKVIIEQNRKGSSNNLDIVEYINSLCAVAHRIIENNISFEDTAHYDDGTVKILFDKSDSTYIQDRSHGPESL